MCLIYLTIYNVKLSACFGFDINQLSSIFRTGMSQSSLSTVMSADLDVIINMTSRCIKSPDSVGEQADIKRQFTAFVRFPKCNRRD